MFSKFKKQIFYVQVMQNSISFHNPKTKNSFILTGDFSTKSHLVEDFGIAESLCIEGFKKLSSSFIAPVVIMHPHKTDGESLSQIEEQLFKELALSAGAREVQLWIGEVLTDKDILNK